MELVKKFEIEYCGKKIVLEKLDNGNFKKPFIAEFTKSGWAVTWLDDCRIPFKVDEKKWNYPNGPGGIYSADYQQTDVAKKWNNYSTEQHDQPNQASDKGRFPANLLVSDNILDRGIITKSSGGAGDTSVGNLGGHSQRGRAKKNGTHAGGLGDSGDFSRYFDIDKWFEELQKTFPFLIVTKASKKEKNNGLENSDIEEKVVSGDSSEFGKMGINTPEMREKRGVTAELPKYKNSHPTVKPIKLMAYLVALGSRTGDVILDPFCGSGTTCIAAKIMQRQYIGIEMNEEYKIIAEERIKHYGKDS